MKYRPCLLKLKMERGCFDETSNRDNYLANVILQNRTDIPVVLLRLRKEYNCYSSCQSLLTGFHSVEMCRLRATCNKREKQTQAF